MHSPEARLDRGPDKPPVRETRWKIAGVVFYVFMAVGAVYHVMITF